MRLRFCHPSTIIGDEGCSSAWATLMRSFGQAWGTIGPRFRTSRIATHLLNGAQLGEHWKQSGGKDDNDRDNHEKVDQRRTTGGYVHGSVLQ
ncbi:MAG: hypothetical protein ACM3VW_01830 [Bacteroidota bacterium]